VIRTSAIHVASLAASVRIAVMALALTGSSSSHTI